MGGLLFGGNFKNDENAHTGRLFLGPGMRTSSATSLRTTKATRPHTASIDHVGQKPE